MQKSCLTAPCFMEWSGAAFGVVLLALPGFRCGAFRTAPFLSLVWWSLTLSRATASGEFFYTLFNVILAVYVDITMRAAKMTLTARSSMLVSPFG